MPPRPAERTTLGSPCAEASDFDSAAHLGLGAQFLPANSAITQNAGRRLSGTASALGGGLPFMTGASTTPLTGAFGSQTVLMTATCMAVPFALAAVAAVSLRRWTVEPGDEDVLQAPSDALDDGDATQRYLDRSVVRATVS